MQLTIRTWTMTPAGGQFILETVTIDDRVFELLQKWGHQMKDTLLAFKYSDEDGKSGLAQIIYDSFNALTKSLPDVYRKDMSKVRAVGHYFTLAQDNPELIV